MENIEFVDRYSATGTPRPDESSCEWCEAMGVAPIQTSKANEYTVNEGANGRLIIIGQKELDDTPIKDDGFIFVMCPKCFGTRKKDTTNEQKLEQLRKEFNL